MRAFLVTVFALSAAYSYLLTLPPAARPQAVSFYQPDRFAVIAHGNGRALMPGNTLEAGIHALKVGADILELDIHLTADKHLVVRHDDIIDTTTNGAGVIAEMTLANIQQFDVGFHEIDYPQLIGPGGIVVPTLESLFQQLPTSRFLIELKPEGREAADHLCSLITQYALAEQIVVGSFHSSVLRYFRTICPTVPTSLGQTEVISLLVLSLLGLGHLYESSGVSVQLPWRYGGVTYLSDRLVDILHHLNLKVEVWTVNDPVIMGRLIKMGVDGVITDRPDILYELTVR
ncbi:MAG: glycerophosphodiester phosphodiesterase [Porticoccaceae bacterium]